MTFAQIPAGAAVFLDANTIVYHFAADPIYGAACTQLLKRVELQQLSGFTSTHVLADVAHRLMTLEAINRFGWPASGIANHLRRRHSEIPKLTVYQQAMSGIGQMGIQLLPLTLAILQTAASICQQYELMTGDALVVALMRSHGLTNIASLDTDFDGVPGMVRYTPT